MEAQQNQRDSDGVLCCTLVRAIISVQLLAHVGFPGHSDLSTDVREHFVATISKQLCCGRPALQFTLISLMPPKVMK